MSYHIPKEGESVVFVDSLNELHNVHVGQVIDEQAGVIRFAQDSGTWNTARYVDPAGATEYEEMSWHYPSDDVSRIGQASPSRLASVPEYAKSYVRARRKKNVDSD